MYVTVVGFVGDDDYSECYSARVVFLWLEVGCSGVTEGDIYVVVLVLW